MLKSKVLTVAVAAAALFLAGCAANSDSSMSGNGSAQTTNSCKGHNSCKGGNSCKGKGN